MFWEGEGSHYVAHAGLELDILLLQPPECLDYRHAPPQSTEVYTVIHIFFIFT
jgi:hypothetical protein